MDIGFHKQKAQQCLEAHQHKLVSFEALSHVAYGVQDVRTSGCLSWTPADNKVTNLSDCRKWRKRASEYIKAVQVSSIPCLPHSKTQLKGLTPVEKALLQGLSAMQAGPWTCDKPGSGCSCQDSCDGCSLAACECAESDTWEDADDPGKRE